MVGIDLIMKRINTMVVIVIMCIIMSSCNIDKQVINDEIIFSDDNFVNEYFEIYASYKEYLGKEITLDGQFYISNKDLETYYMVIRYAYGICDIHEYEAIGFEIDVPINMNMSAYENKWVKVKDMLDVYYEDDEHFLILRDPSLTILGDVNERYVY